MAEDCPKPDRPWRVIAEEVSKEADSDKIAELSEELIRALDNENKRPDPTPNRDEERVKAA